MGFGLQTLKKTQAGSRPVRVSNHCSSHCNARLDFQREHGVRSVESQLKNIQRRMEEDEMFLLNASRSGVEWPVVVFDLAEGDDERH